MAITAVDSVGIVTEKVAGVTCGACGCELAVSGLNPFDSADCPQCGNSLTIPGRLGQFLLLDLIGSGGMGGVYRAIDETLDRLVAVKVMLRELSVDENLVETFRREAKAAAQLSHPHIVQVHSFGKEMGQLLIVMEFVDGRSLATLIHEQGQLNELLVMRIGHQISQALGAAEDIGLMHGDVKPENIVLDERKHAKLVDFGLAGFIHQTTFEGVWGTPYYIAPEKVKREEIDERADMYSLGATLYHALSGEPPFTGDNPLAVVNARLNHSPKELREVRPYVNQTAESIVARMMSPRPAGRYRTYVPLINEMRKIVDVLSAREMESQTRDLATTESESPFPTAPDPREDEQPWAPQPRIKEERSGRHVAKAVLYLTTIAVAIVVAATVLNIKHKKKQGNALIRQLAFHDGKAQRVLNKIESRCDKVLTSERTARGMAARVTNAVHALRMQKNAVFVSARQTWKYKDDGSDLGMAWVDNSYDDSQWKSGQAELGYGHDDETTIVEFGPDPANKYPTTYFRTTFTIDDITGLSIVKLKLLRDDGAIVYINGAEVLRENMPSGPVDHRTYAIKSKESPFRDHAISKAAFVEGKNTIAIEIHQWRPGSSDISFDAELAARFRGASETEANQIADLARQVTFDALRLSAKTNDVESIRSAAVALGKQSEKATDVATIKNIDIILNEYLSDARHLGGNAETAYTRAKAASERIEAIRSRHR
jgi:serine/threonine protein kinase